MASYPCFLPLNVASKYFAQWSSNLQLKTNHNVYFKSLHGESQVSFDNQSIFKGNLKNGIFQGKGSYVWPNGVRYDGEFKDSCMTGFGKFTWPNGSYYEGQLLNSKRNGQGVFYCSDQGYTYSGQWKQGEKWGKGKIEYKDQSFYEGYFQNDKKSGFGKMTYVSKNEYEGQWKNDKKSGKGVMNWYSKHEKYNGEWKDDQPDGYGEYFWYENKVEYKIFKNMYKGYWKCGKRNGFGCFFYSNGYRYEGYFLNNLKQGWGILTDEYGTSKATFFSNNRPNFIQQKKSLKALKQIAQDIDKKLPSIATKAHQKNPSDLSKEPSIKPATMENEYKKYIDFDHPQINENFYNMLLRNNSRLRILYKTIGTSNMSVKDYYSGMVLQNYWKVLKQCKIASENNSLVSIDREFCKSRKFNFSVSLPHHGILDTMQSFPTDGEVSIQYENILWDKYFKKIRQSQLKWGSFSLDQKIDNILPDFESIDIHNPNSIILFRHFVCLLIHTANLLEEKGKSLKQKLQWLISSLEHVNDNLKNQKYQESLTQGGNKNVFVPDWVKALHEQLIAQVEGRQKTIQGYIDTSLTVRKMYSMMDIGNIFKDQNQKILYLQRIQRYLNIKTSPLKKQHRHLYNQFDKTIKSNPNFNYLMNYELNTKEINQFLFLCINKKVIAHNQQQFQVKYKQIIKNLINEISGLKIRGSDDKKCTFTRKYSKSRKDLQKEALIILMEKEKLRKIEEEKAKKIKERQQKQVLLMSKEDYDAEEIVLERNDQENEYY